MFALIATLALLTNPAWVHARRGHDIIQRPRSTPCAGLGGSSTDTAPYKLTLAALNTTLPNSSKIGVPLALGWSASEGDEGTDDWDMSIQVEWDSSHDDWPYFTLESGSLLPQPGALQQGLEAYSQPVHPGGEVSVSVNTAGSSRASPSTYCAVVRDGQTLLALNNDADGFSLCEPTEPHPYMNRILVWNADANHRAIYDHNTCYDVEVVVNPYYGPLV